MDKPPVTKAQGRTRESLLSRKWRLLFLLVLLLLTACAGGKEWKYLPASAAEERSIYVVAHGWHTGVVLSRDDLGEELAFVKDYLRQGRYYEFGWGEAEFYQAEKVTPSIFLRAVFWANPSVMHVFSVPESPEKSFPGSDMVELNLSETGLKHLQARLRASFALDEQHRPYPLKQGPHSESRFFKGKGDYLIINTCNRWMAQLLESGGVPMDTVFTLRAASVMRQVKDARQRYQKLRRFGTKAPAPMSDLGLPRKEAASANLFVSRDLQLVQLNQ